MQDPRAVYNQLVREGLHPVDAAKQAQERTGMSVVTGRAIKRGPKFTSKGKVASRTVGQYGNI